MLLFAAIASISSVHFALKYLSLARELKRLRSNAKSPMLELFGTTLTGLSTIRAFGKVDIYVSRMSSAIDDVMVASWCLWMAENWMACM